MTLKQSFSLDLGQTLEQQLSFSVDETQYSELLTILKTGNYKIGFRLIASQLDTALDSAGQLTFTVTDLNLNLVTAAGGLSLPQ